jgi:hypothetical protein
MTKLVISSTASGFSRAFMNARGKRLSVDQVELLKILFYLNCINYCRTNLCNEIFQKKICNENVQCDCDLD